MKTLGKTMGSFFIKLNICTAKKINITPKIKNDALFILECAIVELLIR